MLKYENLSVKYGENLALDDFSLEMKKSEIIALVGESGSGKTTVIRAAIGLLAGEGKIIAGDLSFKGQSLLKLDDKSWRAIRGKKISMIFQDSGAMLNPIRKIGKQFVEFLRLHSDLDKKEALELGIKNLEKMGLADCKRIMDSYIFQLSGGQKQRVGIAMAMSFQPDLLLADEPTSALDVTTQAQIIQKMLDLRNDYGTSILIVTHNLAVASYIADRILVMKDGKIVESARSEEIISNPKEDYTKKLLAAVPDMRGERYV